MSSPQWREVTAAWALAQVSPLAGWPDEYAAFVADGVLAIANALADARNEKTQATRKGPPPPRRR